MSGQLSNVISPSRRGESRLRSFLAKVLLTFLGVIVALLLLELLLQLYIRCKYGLMKTCLPQETMNVLNAS
jgi:hypothetical protein